MDQLRPIQTLYKGYKFRSRTEARWAVFFDAMGYTWEYEKEGYVLEDNTWYLPDFWLPDFKAFAEVKGKAFTIEEKSKCRLLSKSGYEVLLLDGQPDEKSYPGFRGGEDQANVVFMPIGNKFYPFFYSYDFDRSYMDITMECINKSRAARFEFGETS